MLAISGTDDITQSAFLAFVAAARPPYVCIPPMCHLGPLVAPQGPILAFIFAVKELLEGAATDSAAGPPVSRAPSNSNSNGPTAPLTAGQPPITADSPNGAPGKLAGGLPFNLVFVFEGEEENGSIGFKEAVSSNLRWFEGTQLIVISNTNWVGENLPCITYGMVRCWLKGSGSGSQSPFFQSVA